MSKQRRNLPLHVLPAFEAAARHGSFRLAASELHLTPSAISHQIRTLEDALGLRLFQRLARGLKLTEAGERYASTVRDALDSLDTQIGSSSTNGHGRLRVSMPDWVARFVVLPMLSSFGERAPHLDLEINTSMSAVDLEAGEADAAIRLGMGEWSGLRSYRLSKFTAEVVASPLLAAAAHELSDKGELPIVCLERLEQCTREALATIGLSARPERALRLDSYLDVMHAAEEGLGVALTFSTPKVPLPPNARLVALSSQPLPVPFSMFFVCREIEANRPDISTLRSSLFDALSSTC